MKKAPPRRAAPEEKATYERSEVPFCSTTAARLQPLATKLHRLGARALAELLAEIIDRHPQVLDRIERYAEIDPDMLALVGADRFAPPLPRLRRVA